MPTPGRALSVVAIAVAALANATGAVPQTAASQAASAPVPSSPPVVELVKALSWPLIATVIALLFRKPLWEFLGALFVVE